MNNANLFDAGDITVQMPNQLLADGVVKISVIGVGGGGCNMIDHMINKGSHKVDLIIANTDKQALNVSRAPKKIQLGIESTKGLGAGMRPEVGRDAAIESYEEIKDALENADIVFIAAGLGGGTGTGATAIVAKAAKEAGALTVCVVTKPFSWEGKKRAGLANLGLEEIKKVSDSIIIVPNDKLINMIDANIGLKNGFKVVNDVLYDAVNGMCGVILNPGNSDINADFADVRTVMQYKGMSLMGIGHGKGEGAALKALEKAIDSPLVDKVSLHGAKGVLIHFTINPDVPLLSINNVMIELNKIIDSDPDIIFGTTTDSSLAVDEVKITLVATGSDNTNQPSEEYNNNDDIDSDKPILANTKTIQAGSEDFFDVPPLMRNYEIKHRLK